MVELNQLAEGWWEHLRSALLVALARECKDGKGHESLLTDLVNTVYIAADREQVRTTLVWLHERKLVEAAVVSGALAAKLTDRGRDTAEGHRTVDGVKLIEGLTGGDIGAIAVEAGNKYGLIYEVAGIRKTFGINDFAGAVRSFVVDAIASLAGGDRAAVDILAAQSYTDVAAGLAAASSAIWRLRNAAPAFATGGPVRGPGTGTSDDILAWLSNGEHVIQASTVGRFGPDVIDLVNRGDLDGAHRLAQAKGKLPRFAEGGAVDAPTLHVPAAPRVGPASVATAYGGADSAELLRRVVERLEAILAATDGKTLCRLARHR